MRYLPAMLIGRLIRVLVRLVRPGGGSALPGLIVSKLAPNLVYQNLRRLPRGLVIITGTAGKSTTTKMVVAIARAHGLVVFTNPSTANIQQGFFSTIIKSGSWFGKVSADIAIIEMDEGHAATLVRQVKPEISVILNVFEDQLDRFIDPALVRDKLQTVALETKETVLLNADDQNCLLIAQELLNEKKKIFFSVDPSVGSFDYAKTYLSEIATPKSNFIVKKLAGREVQLETPHGRLDVQLPSRGIHFALDCVAAIATAEALLGEAFDENLAVQTLNELPPVFSRGELKEVNGETVEFILVQNPVSMQLNLDNLPSDVEQIFFAIGRDVHDPSWLWTVNYSKLRKVDIVSGFNYADAALALGYNGVEISKVEPDYFKAISDFLSLPKPKSGTKTVIYSADAMRRLRRHMGFTDPEDVERG